MGDIDWLLDEDGAGVLVFTDANEGAVIDRIREHNDVLFERVFTACDGGDVVLLPADSVGGAFLKGKLMGRDYGEVSSGDSETTFYPMLVEGSTAGSFDDIAESVTHIAVVYPGETQQLIYEQLDVDSGLGPMAIFLSESEI